MKRRIFAERLKELRKEKGLSTTQLAEAIKITDSAISRWENNQRVPSMDSIILLCEFFGCSADYLIGLKDY